MLRWPKQPRRIPQHDLPPDSKSLEQRDFEAILDVFRRANREASEIQADLQALARRMMTVILAHVLAIAMLVGASFGATTEKNRKMWGLYPAPHRGMQPATEDLIYWKSERPIVGSSSRKI